MKRKDCIHCVVKTLVIFLAALLLVPSLSTAMAPSSWEKNSDKIRITHDEGWQRNSYHIGIISHLTRGDGFFYFESNNQRVLNLLKTSSGSWSIDYTHYKGGWKFFLSGYEFRGILRPHFICGVFYNPDSSSNTGV